MFAPRPTNSGLSLVLLACLTASSLVSAARTVCTVYLPLTAVHVPRLTTGEPAPAGSGPVYAPVSVFPVAPVASLSVSVTPCAPEPLAWVPWFLITTVKVTVLPADGFDGDQATGAATR